MNDNLIICLGLLTLLVIVPAIGYLFSRRGDNRTLEQFMRDQDAKTPSWARSAPGNRDVR